MKEEFILKLFEKFEKGTSAVMHIKDGDYELLLKKEGAFNKKETAPAPAVSPVYYGPPPVFAPSGMGAAYPQAMPVQAVPAAGTPAGIPVSAQEAASAAAQSQPVQAAPPGGSPAADKNLVFIKSPIVGTFYRAPSPDSPPYVEKGTAVKKGQPLCVLEAMKMMNTLECEYDGVIEDILASNGDLVEFDQNIFAIRVK